MRLDVCAHHLKAGNLLALVRRNELHYTVEHSSWCLTALQIYETVVCCWSNVFSRGLKSWRRRVSTRCLLDLAVGCTFLQVSALHFKTDRRQALTRTLQQLECGWNWTLWATCLRNELSQTLTMDSLTTEISTQRAFRSWNDAWNVSTAHIITRGLSVRTNNDSQTR